MEQKNESIVQVDEDGKIVGPVFFREAHPKEGKGIRHVTSNVFLFEDKNFNRILLTKRSKNISRPGAFNVTIGGHVNWLTHEGRSEDPMKTALKELSEEVFYGLPLPNVTLNHLAYFKKDTRPNDPEYIHLFSTVYPGPFNPDLHEVEELYFANLRDVQREILERPEKYVSSARPFLNQMLSVLEIKLS